MALKCYLSAYCNLSYLKESTTRDEDRGMETLIPDTLKSHESSIVLMSP